jgi:hypothetical protein
MRTASPISSPAATAAGFNEARSTTVRILGLWIPSRQSRPERSTGTAG